MRIKKTYFKYAFFSLFLLSAFFLGVVTVQGENPNNVVPMNDETQACREACGLGEGKPSGDFFGYDTANECLNNCFAAKGIGGVEGSCSPTIADNCCNAFAAPGQDPDCDTGIEFGQCFNSSSDFASCTAAGGTFERDPTCAAFNHHFLDECIDEFDFTQQDCNSIGGTVEDATNCFSGQGCFRDISLTGRCNEVVCPNFGDQVQLNTIDSATGDATFTNLTDNNRNYTCSLIFDYSGDSFSCKTDVTVGDVLTLVSLGLPGGSCQTTQFNIGTNTPSGCVWRCSIVP